MPPPPDGAPRISTGCPARIELGAAALAVEAAGARNATKDAAGTADVGVPTAGEREAPITGPAPASSASAAAPDSTPSPVMSTRYG